MRSRMDGGSACSKTSDIRQKVSFSIPLAAETTIASGAIAAAIFPAVRRMTCDGTTTTTSDFPATAAARSLVGRSRSESVTPGRKTLFSRSCSICALTSGSKTHWSTSCPFRANRSANAVPQLPAPITAIFIFCVSFIPLLFIGDSQASHLALLNQFKTVEVFKNSQVCLFLSKTVSIRQGNFQKIDAFPWRIRVNCRANLLILLTFVN